MRIIIIHTFYKNVGGGEDVVFNNETELLRKHGHEVEALVFSNESIRGALSKFSFIFKSIYNFRSARVLSERIKSFKPDLIHVHNTFFVASPSIFTAARKYKIPVVHTLHNYRLICPSATLYHRGEVYTRSTDKLIPFDAIFKKVYRNSMLETAMVISITAFHKIIGTYKNCIDRFIILNSFSKPTFVNSSLNVNEDKFIIKPNFVEDPGISENEKEDYFVFVGRLTEEKGVLTLLETFKDNSQKLKIFGGGELEKVVEKAASENENIEFFGFRDRSEIMTVISKAKALIFPSEWYETFGLTIIEAFSVYTPVLVSDTGGHSELVEDGVSGYHFKTGDADDLNQKLSLFESSAGIMQMGRNARAVYEKNYSPEKNYQKLIKIYTDLLIEKGLK